MAAFQVIPVFPVRGVMPGIDFEALFYQARRNGVLGGQGVAPHHDHVGSRFLQEQPHVGSFCLQVQAHGNGQALKGLFFPEGLFQPVEYRHVVFHPVDLFDPFRCQVDIANPGQPDHPSRRVSLLTSRLARGKKPGKQEKTWLDVIVMIREALRRGATYSILHLSRFPCRKKKQTPSREFVLVREKGFELFNLLKVCIDKIFREEKQENHPENGSY